MRVPALRLRTLLIVVALAGVFAFGLLRCDIPSLGQQVIWRGPEAESLRATGSLEPCVLDPQLAFWFIPCVTILLVEGTARRRCTSAAIGLIILALLSWVVLRRLAPGNIRYLTPSAWPATHLAVLRRWLSSPPNTAPRLPGLPHLERISVYQCADLFCLVVLLLIALIVLFRPLPRRFLAIAALAVNGLKFKEWADLMWLGDHWTDYQTIARGNLSLARAANPLYSDLRVASWVEVAEVPLMITVMAYLVGLILLARNRRRQVEP